MSSLVSWCLLPLGFIAIYVLSRPVRHSVMNLIVKTSIQILLVVKYEYFLNVLMVTKFRCTAHSVMHREDHIEYNRCSLILFSYRWSSFTHFLFKHIFAVQHTCWALFDVWSGARFVHFLFGCKWDCLRCCLNPRRLWMFNAYLQKGECAGSTGSLNGYEASFLK